MGVEYRHLGYISVLTSRASFSLDCTRFFLLKTISRIKQSIYFSQQLSGKRLRTVSVSSPFERLICCRILGFDVAELESDVEIKARCKQDKHSWTCGFQPKILKVDISTRRPNNSRTDDTVQDALLTATYTADTAANTASASKYHRSLLESTPVYQQLPAASHHHTRKPTAAPLSLRLFSRTSSIRWQIPECGDPWPTCNAPDKY